MQRSNNARATGGADLLLQRTRAWGQRVLLAQRRGGWWRRFFSLQPLSHIFYLFLHFSAAAEFPCPYRFSSARLLVCDSFLNHGYFSLSFVKEREPHSRPLAGMSKAIPGRRSTSPEAAPPPARSSRIPASVIRCLCTAPEMRCCDIACNAALK